MIDLGTTDFYIGEPSIRRRQLKEYSTQLFTEWEEHVRRNLELPDYSLVLEIEEGSIKGAGKIAAVLGALYVGIGNYGDFMQGLQTIRGQISAVGDYLAAQAGDPFKASGCETKVRKRSGSLGELQRLFVKVQRREITAEEAMRDAETLLGDEATKTPGFMCDLKKSLQQAPLFPQQLPLLPEATEQDLEFAAYGKRRRHRPSPPPTAPLSQHFRVEVWRDSKNDKRNVRMTRL